MNKKLIYRWTFYIFGLLILALGIILNTKCGLGVSPIVSVAYSFSLITGMKFGNAALLLYSLFVIIEMILHFYLKRPKKQYLLDAAQIALSIVFTRFMNLFSDFIPQLDTQYSGKWQGSIAFRIAVLAVAVIFTGVGAAMSLNMRLVPNPGDGIVQAVADTINKSVGFTKNCWDVLMVCITLCVTFTMYDKISSSRFSAVTSVIGAGTVIAVIGVGRVVAVFNKLTLEKTTLKAGIKINTDREI